MLVVDANLLIYAYHPNSPHHAMASAWWQRTVQREELIGLPIFAITSFIRVLTDSRISKEQTISLPQAIAAVERWLRQPNVIALYPGDQHWNVLKRLAEKHNATGPLLSDAKIAAIAIEHGGEVCSTDDDFLIFTDVVSHNPRREGL